MTVVSKLATWTNLTSWKYSKKTEKTIGVTWHHMAGNLSKATMENIVLNSTRQMSCNYAIYSDGTIECFVPEDRRSWCSSSNANDQRHITFEIANDGGAPNWHVSDKAIESAIALTVDICKRNGITKIYQNTNKDLDNNYNQPVTWHCEFSQTSCPGPYLKAKTPSMIAEVNKRLSGSTTPTPSPSGTLYKVQCGAFKTKANATAYQAKLKSAGYETIIKTENGYYKVQTGAFAKKQNAVNMMNELKSKGFDAVIVTSSASSSTPSKPATPTLKVGARIRIKAGATDRNTGRAYSPSVYQNTYYVMQILSDGVVFGPYKGNNAAVTGRTAASNVTIV